MDVERINMAQQELQRQIDMTEKENDEVDKQIWNDETTISKCRAGVSLFAHNLFLVYNTISMMDYFKCNSAASYKTEIRFWEEGVNQKLIMGECVAI